ncbi:MAG: 2Fe-2S iron-sulfur cluster-binding protein [Gaiellales bacterium]
MSDITLTIDGREVTVPAGTGLVEAAASAGLEIPVFCYEPRIGPAIGACRMCLIEIEGVPKLQVACATSVRPGMVVSTVSDNAREAQEAVLEFLLINHPLDCPVCDKGGECPLQDHAFRWGAGTSRLRENKRVNDKPIPISPLIALDRERCILCWRCVRFSSEVSEDLQLIARERGSRSIIATFEGRHYDGAHSGNIVELCPVGALTSTQYRFTARPWEAPDHPSISPWDPAGTNISNTVREGRVVRVISRRNDAVDNGWIDDRTRFSYAAYNGPARIRSAQLRTSRDRPSGNRPIIEQSQELALEWLHEQLAADAGERELWVLSGNETLEVVHAVQQLAAQTGGRVVAEPGASAAAPQHSARIEDLRAARHALVLGHADLLDLAPGLDLWLRRARQNGASITVAGVGGTRLTGAGTHLEHVAPGGLDAFVTEFCARIGKAVGPDGMTDPSVVIYRDGELSAESLALLAATFGFPRDGSGFLAIQHTANARGLAALGVPAASWDEIFAHTGGVVYMGVDPSRSMDDEQWGPSVKKAAWVAAVDALPTPLHDTADMVIPGAWSGEQEGTLVNLEGRLQRMMVGAASPDGVQLPLRWVTALTRRLGGSTVASHAAGAFRQLSAAHAGALPAAKHGEIPAEGILGVTAGAAPTHQPKAGVTPADGELALYVAPHLFDCAEAAHMDAMEFLRDEAKLHLHRADAEAHGLGRADRAVLQVAGRDVEVTIVTSTRIARGHARVHAGTPGFAAGRTGWTTARLVGAVAPTDTDAVSHSSAVTDGKG